MGPLYAHLGRDAYPKKLMKKVAPKVSEWVLRMNQPDRTDTDYMLHDKIPETLIPVLDIIFKSQGPKTKAVIKKTDEYMNLVSDRNQLFRRMSGKIEFKLGQYVGLRPAEIHVAWLRQKTLHEYDQLNKKLKKWFKAITFMRGMKSLQNAAFSTTYKTVWCAGPSIEYVKEILSLIKEFFQVAKKQEEKV